jgi:tetratricopeptide (TPR) repeat protein
MCLLVSSACLVSTIQGGTKHDAGAKQIYDLHFGKNPFLPSQALSESGEFIPAEAFPTAAYCGKCHQAVHNEWRQSAHANSFRAPFYLRNVELLIKEKGIEFTRHCEGCHNPIALFSGALTKDSQLDRSFDEDGITCMVCHSIKKIQNTGGTGSYVMGIPAVMLNPDGTPATGAVSYDDIFANPKLHSKAVMRDFYRTSEFCAVCHKAALPKELNGYKWQRAFSAYDEWQQSSWARESPVPFYKKDAVSTCQTCHMPVEEVQQEYTRLAGRAASHRWLGANTAIPAYYGYQEQLEKVQAFLKDALAVDIFGLSKEPASKRETLLAPIENASYVLRAGESVTVHVLVQNKKIGHSLVPEQRDFYESWVEFSASDATGRVIYHSGALDADGYLDPQAHSYTNRLVSGDGKLLDLHQVWSTRVKAYDNTILPGRSDLVRYKFWIPANAKSPIRLTAKVNYRRFRRGFTNFVFDDHRAFTVVEMVSKSTDLAFGSHEPRPETDKQGTVLRWNNYGIALLSQQQYWLAEQAFRQAIKINPSYADAYINIAIAQYSTLIENKREIPDGVGNLSLGNLDFRKFEPALENLKYALALSPESVRATYYEGLILRFQNKLSEAISNQKRVIRDFPRLRQARQELGYIYFLQKNYELARAEFEALQAINPDDLSAHYYLSILYSRLGLKDRAAIEGQLYADHRDDPAVTALSQEFLRANPDIAAELSPQHVHENGRKKRGDVQVGAPLQ